MRHWLYKAIVIGFVMHAAADGIADCATSTPSRVASIGLVPPENGRSENCPAVDADVSLRSAYVSRGQVDSDRPVAQPQIVISKFEFNIGVWGNLELTDRSIGHCGFSEVDLMLSYQLPVQPLEAFVGMIECLYPSTIRQTHDDGTAVELSVPATREVFCSMTCPNPWLTPRLELYYDFGEADGFYANVKLAHEFEITSGWTLIPGVSSGWGSRSFNNYYYGAKINALNDGNIYAELEYSWQNGVSLGADLVYTWLWQKDIRDGAGQTYMDNRLLYGGITGAYEF